MSIKNQVKSSGIVGLRLYHILVTVKLFFNRWIFTDKQVIKRLFKKSFGRELDLDNPITLNEKMQWLKLNDHKPIYSTLADKFAVRKWVADRFGEEYLVPLLFETTNYKDIRIENIPDEHCIVKANHDNAHYKIIRDKTKIDYKELRENCRFWLSLNYYREIKEWQYKNIKPRRILIEKLLETKDGKIPNDYKLHFINGKLEFVYVSFDREGVNDRCIYDADWQRLPFIWIPANTYREGMNKSDVPCPASFAKMKEFGAEIAKDFKYVRVDFYDVDGKLFFGEITLHHGSGLDHFYPQEYDEFYGKKLVLD